LFLLPGFLDHLHNIRTTLASFLISTYKLQIDDDGIGEIRLLADVDFVSQSIDCQLTVRPLPTQIKQYVFELRGFIVLS
jgi:hypothetical protein